MLFYKLGEKKRMNLRNTHQSYKKSEGVWILRVVVVLLVEQLQLNGPCDKSSGTGCIGPSLPLLPMLGPKKHISVLLMKSQQPNMNNILVIQSALFGMVK